MMVHIHRWTESLGDGPELPNTVCVAALPSSCSRGRTKASSVLGGAVGEVNQHGRRAEESCGGRCASVERADALHRAGGDQKGSW